MDAWQKKEKETWESKRNKMIKTHKKNIKIFTERSSV